jgi:hypothetical protein
MDLIPPIDSKLRHRGRICSSGDGTTKIEHKSNGDSDEEAGGAGDDNVDEAVMRIVAATANVIVPFEVMKKALSLDFGTEKSSPEGLW